MKNNFFNRKYFLVLMFLALCIYVTAQDTTKKQTIDITSSYKPVLRNAVKINFSATHLLADTNKSVRAYNVPPQNLFFVYEAVPLSPLAITHDSIPDLGLRNFVKAGFGNYATPYFNAGFSFGDGRKALANIYGEYVSSRSNAIKNQNHTLFSVKGTGSYFMEKNELYGRASFKQQDFFLYGYNHSLFDYTKENVLQRFQTFNLQAGFKNSAENGTGINYNPNVDVNIFSNTNKANESSLAIDLPAEKTFAGALSIKAAVKADITGYTSKSFTSTNRLSNNVFSIAPELVYAKPLLNIHAGVTPTWDNGKLYVLPNFYGEAKIQDKVFLLQAGVVGRVIKNTYQKLTTQLPYLQTNYVQRNSKETEIYGGIKATIGSHFNFSAKASWITYNNFPFYINDTVDGKSFFVSFDDHVNDLRIHGDMSFIQQDKFTITGGLTFNGYNGMKNHDRAWSTNPIDIDASIRWWAYKQVLLKADFKAITGAAFLLKNGTDLKLGGGADLNVGVEFAINKKFSAWVDANNILNNKYQRWNQYPVYGFNILGGVIVKF